MSQTDGISNATAERQPIPGSEWRQLPSVPGPTSRAHQSAVFDSRRNRMLLYGGLASRWIPQSDLWELDMGGVGGWSQLATANSGPPSGGHGAVYDPVSDAMWVYDPRDGTVWKLALDQSTTPVLVSLETVRAESDQVTIAWAVSAAWGGTVHVERRTSASDWTSLGSVTPDGRGRVEFTDRGVSAGIRYGYRLSVELNGAEQHGPEIWVEVPLSVRFALVGARPNPSPRRLLVAFSLPGEGPATLEVFDVAGRRVASRAVGWFGAGSHLCEIAESDLASGLYLLRLTRGRESLTARAVVVP